MENKKDSCFQVRIARIFNTYGPRMCIDDGRVVSNFVAQVGFTLSYEFKSLVTFIIQKLWTSYGKEQWGPGDANLVIYALQALRRQPLTVYGDGKQTRSFQYVSDLVLNHISLFYLLLSKTTYYFAS